MDAVAQGTIDGLRLMATVVAMLIVIVSLVTLVNSMLSLLADPLGFTPTLQGLLGAVCAPLAWLVGIPWSEAGTAGALLGQKVVLNEFLAYLELARTPAAVLSERSRTILTYALCSFANLGSLGILIGGLAAMAPDRRAEIAELAPRSVVAGFLASLLSAAVVGTVM
jgi:CNT family concentrative nucleoside transporter